MKQSGRSETDLEALKAHTCDLTDAGTDSNGLQFTFCNEEFSQHDLECAFDIPSCNYEKKKNVLEKCCRTNKFQKNAWANQVIDIDRPQQNDDDGGEELGPCEGFPIGKPTVFTYRKRLRSIGRF